MSKSLKMNSADEENCDFPLVPDDIKMQQVLQLLFFYQIPRKTDTINNMKNFVNGGSQKRQMELMNK